MRSLKWLPLPLQIAGIVLAIAGDVFQMEEYSGKRNQFLKGTTEININKMIHIKIPNKLFCNLIKLDCLHLNYFLF